MIQSAQTPVFLHAVSSATYPIGSAAAVLDGSASVTDGGTITYQWRSSADGVTYANIPGATGATYLPPTSAAGTVWYQVVATNKNGYPDGLLPSETLYPSNDLYPVAAGTFYTAAATSVAAKIEVKGASAPVFRASLRSAEYNIGSTADNLDGTATAQFGTITYQWQKSTDGGKTWTAIGGATAAAYTPLTATAGTTAYRVVATNHVSTTTANSTSNAASIKINAATEPVFTVDPIGASYFVGATAVALSAMAAIILGSLSYQWQKSTDGSAWGNISGATGASYIPPTGTGGTIYYRCQATNVVGSSSAAAYSQSAAVRVFTANAPEFLNDLISSTYDCGAAAETLNGTAVAAQGTLKYQWFKSVDHTNWTAISGAVTATYKPPTTVGGKTYYRVTATNVVGTTQVSATSNTAAVTVYVAETPVFKEALVSAEYNCGAAAVKLDGTAEAAHGTIAYQWQKSEGDSLWSNINGATFAAYTPLTQTGGTVQYRVVATNIVGTTSQQAQSNTAEISVYVAQAPTFSKSPVSAEYSCGAAATALTVLATAPRGTISYQWQKSTDGSIWSNISGATGTAYIPLTGAGGTILYRAVATNKVGTSTQAMNSAAATITVYVAQAPVFKKALASAVYDCGAVAQVLDGTAAAPHGTISYQWYSSGDGKTFTAISGGTGSSFVPPTTSGGMVYYRVTATNIVGTTTADTQSNAVTITTYVAQTPVFSVEPAGAEYDCGAAAQELRAEASAPRGAISYQWQKSTDGSAWGNISGATGASYIPPTGTGGTIYYRCRATNTVGTSTAQAISTAAEVTIYVAQPPVFTKTPVNAQYDSGATAAALTATATATRGTISYQWQVSSTGNDGWEDIPAATATAYVPSTASGGTLYYRVKAKNDVGTSSQFTNSAVATVTVYVAVAPTFTAPLVGTIYLVGDAASALDGTAMAPHGTVSYQWYQDGDPLVGAVGATYTPKTAQGYVYTYFVRAVNTVGDTQEATDSNTVTVTVYGAEVPVFTVTPVSADYIEYDAAAALRVLAAAARGTIAYQWQKSVDGGMTWTDLAGETGETLTPETSVPNAVLYRARATNTVGTSTASADSPAALIRVTAAQIPTFTASLKNAVYDYAAPARALNGSASVMDGGTITYQWYRTRSGEAEAEIPNATKPIYRPTTVEIGACTYRVKATNLLHHSARSAYSGVAEIQVTDTRLSEEERWRLYLRSLRGDFVKLCRLEFLQPDGAVAFALDNTPKGRRSGGFLQDGTLSVNLQNGQRRIADITLENFDGGYDFAFGKIWFGQQIRLSEGLRLPNGDEFLLPQAVFYVSDPDETFLPGQRTAAYHLLDKWAYLDGTLFGNLEGIYEVPGGTNILTVIRSILSLDRGNGYPVDRLAPVISNYWNGKTTQLQDGSEQSVLLTPYTYRCSGDSGAYADILLEMNKMLVGWIGYDQTGRMRLDAGDDDILDATKPVLWDFTPSRREFLGATYSPKLTEVFNDVIVEGQTLSNNAIARGRATNMDIRSDTSIYGALGKRTVRVSGSAYYADEQCQDYAAYLLKRYTILKKSVSIRSSQIFHVRENCLVTIRREDKAGAPVERHLVTGFSRPLAQTGEMTLSATSVQDFPDASITPLPGEE